MDPVLLWMPHYMRILWFIPFAVLLVGAGFFARARRRSDDSRLLSSEPVSGQWLAEARSREEQPW
jgi:cytochrome c-type biogenesis protein CcmH/NrfF